MKISFICSLIIIILSILIYLLFFKKKRSLKTNIFLAFITCIICITILVFPLMEYTNIYVKSFASFIYATNCIRMGQNLSILSKISLDTAFGYIYFILINILFLATPSLTIGIILTYLERIISYIKFKFLKNKKICVFSEINEKSLTIAKNIEDSIIVFANVKEKMEVNIKSIKFSKRVKDINLNSKSDVTIYMIYEDEEENLNEALELISKYKERDNTKIYVINDNEEAQTILDSTNKGKVSIEIINEKERHIFDLLNNKPLYLNTLNKTISILIVGCGNIGKEFLRDAIWCGMIPGYKLKILVVDLMADKIKENINVEMPELLNNYDISFINNDIESNEVIEEIKLRSEINYILISMNNDDQNINTAIMLRRLFLREFNREPIINLYIENEYKKEQILCLLNEKGYSYNFNAFGSVKDIYKQYTSLGSELEKLAIKIHLSYDPDDKDLIRYNLREYNKRSSRACAVHIKYKLYSVLENKFQDDMKENQKLFRKMYSTKIENLLTKNEHDRWMAYMRSIGYVKASTTDVEKYYNSNKHYIDYLARRHPGLVEYEKLDEVSKELSKITSKKVDLKEKDKMIIEFLNKKIEL